MAAAYHQILERWHEAGPPGKRPSTSCLSHSACVVPHPLTKRMPLFTLGSSSSPQTVTDKAPASATNVPPSNGGVVIRLSGQQERILLGTAIIAQPSIQKSQLGHAVASSSGTRIELQDGTAVQVVGPGELVVDHTLATQSTPESFLLLLEYLLGHKPLEAVGFQTITAVRKRLMSELELWGVPKPTVDLPYRLWTATRWTDLTGMYALPRSDIEFLKMEPVALQFDDGNVQCIKVLKRYTLYTAPTPLVNAVADMVTADGLLNRVVGVLSYGNYVVIMLDTAEASTTPASSTFPGLRSSPAAAAAAANDTIGFSTETDMPLTRADTTTAETTGSPTFSGVESIASSSPGAAKENNNARYATQILIKLPTQDKVVTYDLSRNEPLRVPMGHEHVLFYVRGDRHVFCFTPTFCLEIQEFTDAISGATKLRCGQSRLGHESGVARPNTTTPGGASSGLLSGTSQGAASTVMSLFKAGSSGGGGASKKDLWQCYHPVWGTKYASTIKQFRELGGGGIHLVKFYPWGALFTASKAESPFAMLMVDHPKLRKSHGERIMVHVRGLTHAGLSRKDMDVAVTAGLERVYLCCCSQIGSASIIPQASRVDFEVQEMPNKKGQYRLRLVHIDIPEGGPSGASFGTLNALGLLAEYNPRTGAYYQSAYCQQVCPKYTGSNGTPVQSDYASPPSDTRFGVGTDDDDEEVDDMSSTD